jgi:hypothetical protein
MTRPLTGERSIAAVVAVRRSERRQTGGGGARVGVGRTQRRFRFLHLPRGHDALARERPFAVEDLRGQLTPRVGGDPVRPCPSKLGAPETRQRRPRLDCRVHLDQHLQHLAVGRRRHRRIPRLVGRHLTQHRHLLHAAALGHRRRADTEVAHHVFAQVDGVLFFFMVGRLPARRRRGARGLRSLARDRRDQDRQCQPQRPREPSGHRSTPATKSIRRRLLATASRRSTAAVRVWSASRRMIR